MDILFYVVVIAWGFGSLSDLRPVYIYTKVMEKEDKTKNKVHKE